MTSGGAATENLLRNNNSAGKQTYSSKAFVKRALSYRQHSGKPSCRFSKLQDCHSKTGHSSANKLFVFTADEEVYLLKSSTSEAMFPRNRYMSLHIMDNIACYHQQTSVDFFTGENLKPHFITGGGFT